MLSVKSLHYYFDFPRESIRARFARGISWNAVSSVFTQGSVFLTNVIIANLLGREVFGEFGMIQNTVLFFAGMAEMATGVTATKYIAEFRSSDPERAGRILGLCSSVSFISAMIATLVTVLTASWIASAVLNAPHLTLALIISSGIIFFSIINGFQAGALAGLEGYGRLGRAAMVQAVFYIGVCGLFTFLGRLQGALAGMAISFCLRWYIFNRALRQECAAQQISADHRNCWKERAVIIKFAIPGAAIGFLTMPTIWLSNTLLVRQPGGWAQMGIFSAAFSLRAMIIFLPSLMNNVGMSLLNHQMGMRNERKYKGIFLMNIALTQSVVLIGSLIVILLGPWLLRAFGKDFAEGYTVLLILVSSAIVETLSAGIYQVVRSQEKIWLSLFLINAPWCLTFIIAAYFFVPLFLAAGLAWAYVIAWGVHVVMTGLQVWRVGLWRPEGCS
jgi:O-antigen/teichoic acid export membrane protein